MEPEPSFPRDCSGVLSRCAPAYAAASRVLLGEVERLCATTGRFIARPVWQTRRFGERGKTRIDRLDVIALLAGAVLVLQVLHGLRGVVRVVHGVTARDL